MVAKLHKLSQTLWIVKFLTNLHLFVTDFLYFMIVEIVKSLLVWVERECSICGYSFVM
jgi:hypothetical protein